MNRRNISPQAVKICGLTLLCLAVMFGVAAATKALPEGRPVKISAIENN